MLLWSAPAVALGQRGHVLGFSFAGAGEGDGQLKLGGAFKHNEAAGVAVSEVSGDVYVVDRGNFRVEQFGPRGEFIAVWGWGVRDGKAEYERCLSSCRAGLQGAGKGQLREAGAIAVDNSQGGAGTVYVGTNAAVKRPDVQLFSADGSEVLGKLPVTEEGRLDGIATDLQGNVWLYRGEEEENGVIEGFSGAKPHANLERSLSAPLGCPKPGLAVDAGGEDFYVDRELMNSEGECPGAVEGGEARSVVAAKLNAEEVLNTGEAAISELDRENTSAIAVDQGSGVGTPLGASAKGDVYVDNGTSLAAFTAGGALIQRFGSEQLGQGAGVAVNAKTGAVYVLDAASNTVEVFEPAPPGKSTVDSLAAQNMTLSSAALSAQIDPVGADTHYYFQYGTVDCVASPSSCTDTPAPPGTDIGEGFGDQGASVVVEGLRPSTTYFYRVIATNKFGVAEGADKLGTVTTLPSSKGLLADGRAWELVSPPEKDGSGIEPFEKEGSLIQASEDGSAITYVASGPVVGEPEGNRALEPTQVLSSRGAGAWLSQDVVTPHKKGEGFEPGEPSEYRFFSSDLSLGLVQPPYLQEPFEQPPLSAEASEKTLYVRDNPPIAPGASEGQLYEEAEQGREFLSPGYLPLVTAANDTGESKPGERTKFGGRLEFAGATPDLSHVVLASGVSLLSGLGSGLYEWEAGGNLELVSVLPDGTPAGEPRLGDAGANVRNAISGNGSRVVFTEGASETHRLYLHDSVRKETVQVNASQGVIEPAEEENEVGFQGASSDGTKVLFTDSAPLTAESHQRPASGGERNPADLYECEVTEAAGKLACKLRDLTPLASGGSADLLNVIPGISDDGASLYFVANGVLTPNATPGHCAHESTETPPPGATCNLYLWHDGKITLIAALSNEDSGDWGSLRGRGAVGNYVENRPDLADVTARVSPNGEHFAFMSSMPLTGYENLDANHAGVRDQELYLYDASSRLLVCPSCRPGGGSTGVLDTPLSGEGVGLVVDRREDWTGQYLAGSVPGWTPLGIDGASHQPRYLSDTGRLFFNSPDQLVPQATNGKEDVYQYEPAGVGSCAEQDGCVSLISSGTAAQESTFLDASENGDNAFFLTAQPLVAGDHDTNFDMYDARVCTSSSPCLTSEASSERPCETSKSCNPAPFSQPEFGFPASMTSSGPGNLARQGVLPSANSKPTTKAKPLTRAQQLAKALRTCRRKKSKHQRVACERRARRRFAQTKARKASGRPPKRGSK